MKRRRRRQRGKKVEESRIAGARHVIWRTEGRLDRIEDADRPPSPQ